MVNIKYIFLALAVIAVVAFIFFMSRRKSLSFDFELGGNIADLLSQAQGRYAAAGNQKGIGVYVDVPLTTTINNEKAAKTVLENLMGSLSYNGEQIIQTNAGSANLARIEIPGKDSKTITESVQVLINPSSIKLLTELVKGNKPSIKYNFGATVFGKPYSFTNKSIINN